MIYRVLFATFFALANAAVGFSQDRVDIMYLAPVDGGPTYKEVVEVAFGAFVFPAELRYNSVGISRDNVIAERIETDNRGGYWITVRARYSGRIGPFKTPVAERARVYYDNGNVKIDLGGLKGLLNTEGIADWISKKLPSKTPAQQAGYFRFENRYSGKQLNVTGDAEGAKADGASVNVWFANNESTVQQWKLIPTDNGYYRVENRYSGKHLNVTGDAEGAKRDGAGVNVWFANDESTVQQWKLIRSN